VIWMSDTLIRWSDMGAGNWVLVPGSWFPGPRCWVPCAGFWFWLPDGYSL